MKALPRFLTLTLAVALLPVGGTRADDAETGKPAAAAAHPCDGDVWCGLYLAKGSGPGDEDADEFQKHLLSQLGKAFPDHTSFRLIGENHESIFKEYECWIVPSKQLFLKIDSLGNQPDKTGGVHVHLQLWQQDHVLLKSDAILRRQPVFIAGPKWGDSGQLIMVLKLMREIKTP